jgi:hypothetical protein
MKTKSDLISILRKHGEITKYWAENLEEKSSMIKILEQDELPKNPMKPHPNKHIKQVSMYQSSLGHNKPTYLYKWLYIKYLSFWINPQELSYRMPLYLLQTITNYCDSKTKPLK